MSQQVWFSTGEFSTLCFTHAVKEAVKGKDVSTHIAEDSHEYFHWCDICKAEAEKSWGDPK